jgi:hypothetical protein
VNLGCYVLVFQLRLSGQQKAQELAAVVERKEETGPTGG